jgi:hypothetical protein
MIIWRNIFLYFPSVKRCKKCLCSKIASFCCRLFFAILFAPSKRLKVFISHLQSQIYILIHTMIKFWKHALQIIFKWMKGADKATTIQSKCVQIVRFSNCCSKSLMKSQMFVGLNVYYSIERSRSRRYKAIDIGKFWNLPWNKSHKFDQSKEIHWRGIVTRIRPQSFHCSDCKRSTCDRSDWKKMISGVPFRL